MNKLVKTILTFVVAFAIILTIGQNETVLASTIETDSTEILDAYDNIRFYSSYNYQTLTEDRLNQLIVDFYVPASYGDVTITWELDSTYLSLSNHSEIISVQSTTGLVDIEVYPVTILQVPSILHGDETFELVGHFTYLDESATTSYFGTLVPVIPDTFYGGVLYTFIRYIKLFLEGAALTLGISLVGTVIGFFLALLIVSGKTLTISDSESKSVRIIKQIIQKLASFYIVLFRGTPMIVQASFFWYGLGLFGDALACGLFVVSLNTAAYIAEIIRGGINSIDHGQTEAAKSLGMNKFQTMRYVIFPQAIKNSMPAIGNEFVINIKDTAVLSVIGIFELFNQTRKIAGMHYRQLEAYFVVAIIYLFLTYTVTSILKQVEKRMDLPLKELPSSN
ncbi:MAG: amino acid ABC transporter permease [Bacilli bacterium]|nr:amino acid ABC transporter permease [Bacilli bacterium]